MSFYDHLFCKIFTFSSSPEPLCQFQPILQQNILKENQNCSNVGPCPFPRRDNSNIVCFFFWVYGPTREFFTHMETPPLPVKGCKFNLFSAHLLWNGASVYNGHLRGLVTYCRAFGSWAVTVCFYDLGLSRLGFEHSTSACRAISLTHCATTAVKNNTIIVIYCRKCCWKMAIRHLNSDQASVFLCRATWLLWPILYTNQP